MNRKQKSPEDVELNMAAMLDMAFQLLTFFILTFRPAPFERELPLHMPSPQPLAVSRSIAKPLGETTDLIDPLSNYHTLPIILTSSDDGRLRQIRITEQEVAVDEKLSLFHITLSKMLNDPGSPFDRVIIQVGSKLRYDELMRVIEVCTRQTIGGDQKKLTKLSLVDENSS
jgi:biopolymer transport protein ExbD